MSINLSAAPRLAALATTCLLSVALPAMPAVAQQKIKTKPAVAEEHSQVDFSVSIPTIEAVDSNVEDATLKEILSGNIVEHAEALAGLTATSITVPQIEVTITGQQDDEEQSATITLTDLVLSDIVDGVAGSVSLAESDMTTLDANVNFGALAAADFNIGLVLGFYGLVDTAGQTELETIYRDFSSEGGSFDFEDVRCTVGAVSGSEFKARPLQTSFVDLLATLEGLDEDSEDMDPAMMGQFMRIYADMITAFETSEVTFDGMDCLGTDDDGKRMSFSMAGMTMGAMSPGVYPEVSMDGFEVAVKGEGSFSLDNFTVKPMNMSTLIETLESVPDSIDEAWLEANARNLFPEMEGFALSSLSIDIADPDEENARIKADIGSFDLTLANYLNGIPTSGEMSASNIRAEIPADTGDETLDQLRDLGLAEIDMGFRIATAWDEASSTIDIEEISISGADLGSISMAGTIANATANLFNVDPDIALAAGMGIAVSSLDLDIVDNGLSDLAFGVIAQEQGAKIETVRSVYSGLAEGTVISAMVGIADAVKVGNAIGAFVSGKAKTLQIGIQATNGTGVGVLDFMIAEKDPTTLLDKLSVTAQSK